MTPSYFSMKGYFMKILLSKIVSNPFRKSLDRLSVQELPIRAMFQLRSIVKQLREEMTKWDEIQGELAKKWATKDEAGNPIIEKRDGTMSFYKMDTEKMFQFAAEMGELARIEIDLQTVKIEDLGNVKLTVDDLVELEFIVDGVEEEEVPKKKKKK